MKNNNGMTLIETIIALLILSTATLIMVTGFTTAFRMFNDSNSYKDTTNELETLLQKDDQENTSIEKNEKSTKYVINVTSGGTPIEVKGTLKKVKKNDISLSSFKNGNSDETRKAQKVYKNYCDMMQQLYTYLEGKRASDKKFSFTAMMDDPKIIEYTNMWLKEKKHVNGTISNFINDIPKLYSLIYSNTEINSVVEHIKGNNATFSESDYHDIIPCFYTNKNYEYTSFFYNELYKKNLFLVIGNSDNGTIPDNIYAVYNNYSATDEENKTDEWFVATSLISKSNLNDKSFSSFYTDMSNDSNWELYITTKE